MANADVISAVSASLEARLTDALSTLGPPAPVAKLHDLVTPVASDQPTVTLFLYEIAEDPSVHNRTHSRHEVNGELRLRKAPIGLCLRYMVTAWGGDRHTEQRMLGRVIQVLHDDSALEGLQFAGVLVGSADHLELRLTPLQLEDRARVWSAIGQTYRLSVNYDVRLVNIDVESETSVAPVRERYIGTPGMNGPPSMLLGPRLAASPIWIRLLDTFTGRAPLGPVAVSIERRVGSDWVALDHAHQLGTQGDLVFVNLGRTHDPVATGSFDVRVAVAVQGSIPEAPGGDATLTKTIASWPPDAPELPAQPDYLRLFPGPGYAFGPGIQLLCGRVVDAGGDPVPRACVKATVTLQNALLTEEVRSDGDGRFRLPLRWSAGPTDIHASRGAATGSIAVLVPADLSSTHQITLT